MKNKEKYIDSFISLGLKKQEAEVYFALLQLGRSTVGKISRLSGVQRTFIYDILDDLSIKGLVTSIESEGIKRFSPIPIEQFRKRQLAKLENFEEILPELKALIKTTGERPKVQFFEGIEGFIIAQDDTLNMPRGSEICAYYTGEGLYEEHPEIPTRYVGERVKRRISVRAISTDTPATLKWTQQDKEQLRESRIVSADKFPFANEINIYGNKISILSLQGEILAVVIESESIAKTQKAIFELAWEGAEKYRTKK
ncbi:MAG: hypothetical protein OEV37_00280 [Candidatus Berkelbacteria bacterium]|nr:hypothetical protein [Candidatus Berkelbacteria bacterium]